MMTMMVMIHVREITMTTVGGLYVGSMMDVEDGGGVVVVLEWNLS